MTISFKKVICKLSAFAVVAVSIACMALPASALTSLSPENGVSDIAKAYRKTYGTYSKMECYYNKTKVVSTNSGYDPSWKHSDCYVYGNTGTTYPRLAGGYADGMSKTITKTVSYDTSKLARRYHSSYVNLTSDPLSLTMDNLTIILNKKP